MSTKGNFQKGAVKPFFTISTNIFDKRNKWDFVLFLERFTKLAIAPPGEQSSPT